MKIDKEDAIIFVSEFSSQAFKPKDSFFSKSEEKQEKMIREFAKGTFLPLSLSKSVAVFKAQEILCVFDREQMKKDMKEDLKKEAKKRFEEEVERIESIA